MKAKTITLQEHIHNCLDILKKNPEAKDWIIISSSDEEGNYFNPVYYNAIGGFFIEDEDGSHFYSIDDDMDILKEFHPEIIDPKPNAVCVN